MVELDEAHNDTKITLHRGGKDGPVIATAEPCPEKKYQTDIHMVENKLLIPFHHKHHHHHFAAFSKKYHWKGHKELVEEESGSKVAEYNPSVFEGRRNTIHEEGTLRVPQSEIQDLVVLTAIIVQERKEEALPPVYPKKIHLLTVKSQRHELEHEAKGA